MINTRVRNYEEIKNIKKLIHELKLRRLQENETEEQRRQKNKDAEERHRQKERQTEDRWRQEKEGEGQRYKEEQEMFMFLLPNLKTENFSIK